MSNASCTVKSIVVSFSSDRAHSSLTFGAAHTDQTPFTTPRMLFAFMVWQIKLFLALEDMLLFLKWSEKDDVSAFLGCSSQVLSALCCMES